MTRSEDQINSRFTTVFVNVTASSASECAFPRAEHYSLIRPANHASTRTTQLYDRRADEVNLDEIERILI